MKRKERVRSNRGQVILGIGFLIYVLLVIKYTLLQYRSPRMSVNFSDYLGYSVNLVPFKNIESYIIRPLTGSMNMDIAIKNLAGNFLLFAPLPVFLERLTKRKYSFMKIMPLTFSAIISIELIQLVFMIGNFDVDDLILNLAGAWITLVIIRKVFKDKGSNSKSSSENSDIS